MLVSATCPEVSAALPCPFGASLGQVAVKNMVWRFRGILSDSRIESFKES